MKKNKKRKQGRKNERHDHPFSEELSDGGERDQFIKQLNDGKR
ncbi:hypothetical protein [Salirhabdus salicampi]|nr:hypothetical protein [Salirhabdus salicampi]